MLINRTFFSTLAFFLGLWGVSEIGMHNPKIDAQIEQIDRELVELEDMKRGFNARALRHEDMAEYLQFDQKALLETRRHLQIAEENRQKAAKVQERIDYLNAKRQKLIEKQT